MGTGKKIEPFPAGAREREFERKSLLPLWSFQHRDLFDGIESSRTIEQNKLINTFNHVHFVNGHIFACLDHSEYEEAILLKAYPKPCAGNSLTCRWVDKILEGLKISDYKFRYLIITSRESVILVPAIANRISKQGITVDLPEVSYILDQRSAKRYECIGITAEINQNGFTAKGILQDFNPSAFCVLTTTSRSSSSMKWFNLEEPFVICLYNEDQIIFSGFCGCIRKTFNARGIEFVFSPSDNQIKRFKKQKDRNPRININPALTIVFNHPFFKKKITREIQNISNSGFSVREKIGKEVLIPGMIISELTIQHAGILEIKCSAQVIYRRSEEKTKTVSCGLSIVDMKIESYNKLTQLLSLTTDCHSYISNSVDMESLWEFFFNTGFIYPEKYKFIQPYREKFKETYERLYQNNQNVAVHFTYETDGTIYAHISMLRAYAYTWMIHHYAARPMENKLTGFLVLQQIIRYLNGLYRLPSAKMEYVMTYFRPNNKIVERVFGGFADSLNDPKGCSIDLFSYLSVKKETDLQGKVMKGGWVLRESSALDLWKLNMFYEHHSGGLMMDALNLKEHNMEDIFLEEAYDRMGFARKKKVYSLLRGKDLAAVLIVNLADMGMNLSELINSIKIIIMDQEILRWNTLLAGISMLANNYHYDEIPLLVYPSHYTEKENISIKKQYRLWILNIARHNEQYLEYIKRYRIKLR